MHCIQQFESCLVYSRLQNDHVSVGLPSYTYYPRWLKIGCTDNYPSYRYRCLSKTEMALSIKPHTRNLEKQLATPFYTEYQDGGQEPEVVITYQVSEMTTSFQI